MIDKSKRTITGGPRSVAPTGIVDTDELRSTAQILLARMEPKSPTVKVETRQSRRTITICGFKISF